VKVSNKELARLRCASFAPAATGIARVNWRSVKGLEWVAKSSWPILLSARPTKGPLPVSRKESQ
jgi:hypothetical protein